MLAGVLEHVATFTKSCGLMRFNKYILAVLTFVAKCVGHNDAELETMVDAHGICIVVYGTLIPPSKIVIAPPVVVAPVVIAPAVTIAADGSTIEVVTEDGKLGESVGATLTTVEAVAVTSVASSPAAAAGGGKAAAGGKAVRGRLGLGSDIKLKATSVAPSTQGTPRIGGA